MTIVFRTDASHTIGTGHVMRCLTLARALRARGEVCRFVTRMLPGHMADRIAADGYAVTLLPVPEGPHAHADLAKIDCSDDAARTRAALDGVAVSWLVVDHYMLDARWHEAVCTASCKVLVIDDLADRPYSCDVLLDQSLGREHSDYDGLVPARCRRLIGPRYALLRPEFAANRASALTDRSGRTLAQLLVTMGGVDQADATSAVLSVLRSPPFSSTLRNTVVMGAQSPELARVRTIAQDMPWPTEVLVDVRDMAERMAAADLAIGAGGSTTWERCCVGLPSLIVHTAENQTGNAQAMGAAGAAIDLGPFPARGFEQTLRSALISILDPARLAELSQKSAMICDGDGVARVLAAMLPSAVDFRAAERGDSRRVWEWRNELDKSARIKDDETSFDQHDAWFVRALDDPYRTMRILLQGDLACGYLRLDRNGEHSARVSICVASEARGQGLGQRLLAEAQRLAPPLGLTRLDAEIHPANVISRHLFEKAGYEQDTSKGNFLIYQCTLGNKK